MHLSQTCPKGRAPALLLMIPHAIKFTVDGRGYDSDDRGERRDMGSVSSLPHLERDNAHHCHTRQRTATTNRPNHDFPRDCQLGHD